VLPDHLTPDLALARRFLALHPPRGRVLTCGITGSHHYGFPSPDSDIDIKAIHVSPTASRLGLSTPKDAHDRLMDFEGVECDLTSNEVGQALRLLLRGNGNVLERILSPLRVLDAPEAAELRALATASLHRGFAGHYRGFFQGLQREFDKAGANRAKPLLYCYRVSLTGVHLLRTGELEADLTVLAPRYGLPDVAALIEHKRTTAETVEVPPADVARHRAAWADLEQQLADARLSSPLPESAPNRDAVEAWLVDLRLREL